jgi:LuxR family transcriptional regulator, maltose regulon positive regulatory protein
MIESQPRHTAWVPSTKLRPPALPPDFVPRPRVHERLTEGSGRRLMLVCAPAGFGKTIALAGWLHEARRPWVWVSLDELDSDLVGFTSLLVAALGTVVPDAGRRALALAAQTASPPLSQLSGLLAHDLAGVDDELVIVLDDFHVIQEGSIHALLSLLVRRLPPTIQLVIASREEPLLPVALLRGRREVAEVRADDLRFDRAEALAFVREMSDAPLDLRRVADAVDRSEGWAVGLRLLTLAGPPSGSSQTSPTPAAARERQFVDAYLFDEVLSRQTPELRRFLAQTSLLDRFCAPLCEAVVDGLRPGDGRRLLDASMAAGLFLTSLDDEQRWYRFHHLFRDMLRRRLERDAGPERVRALRRRASDWLAGQGLRNEAATQAIDANDVDRVTSLVETCLMTERSIGVGLMLDSWTRRLPRDVVEASPTLSLARCGMLDIRGEVGELESRLRRVDAMLAGEPSRMSPSLLPIARGQIDTQLAWVLHQMGGADHEARARLERALDQLPVDQYLHRGAAVGLYAISLQSLGRTDDALAWISAELSSGTALHPDCVARLLVGQLYVELASGRLPAAVLTARWMLAFGTASQQPLVIGWGHFAHGLVAYERNDLDGAREHFEAVLALGRDANRLCSVNATLGLARTLVAGGQPAEAERLVLAELEQAEEAGNSFFVEGLRSFMAHLALASDDPDRAANWLAGVTLTRQGITGYDLEDPLLTRARVLVARATSEDLGEASAAVDRAIEAAEARHVIASLVGGLALRAVVERSRGEMSRAAESIARALEIAGPGQFTRTFVDLGPPLTELLAELATHGSLPPGGGRVLMACRAESGVPASARPSRDAAAPRPAEALTWRELDVLLLMDGHFTNKEITRLLGLDEETVRRHATNVYSKLRVTGRRDAVLRAYDLGFLRAEDRETRPSD